MANTLLITKKTAGYFSFVLNDDYSKEIQGIRNDLIIFGTDCHFKTSGGANLIKLQNIQPEDITIVSSGTFSGFTVETLWAKLIEVGFFDWISGGGAGTGTNRFDDLLDTFKYTGKHGKALRVNESQQKLETFTVYNYRKFTELEDTPDTLLANKMVVTNPVGDALVFAEIPEQQPQYLNSFGYFDYSDLITQTTPLNIVANTPSLVTNDALGEFTSSSNAPYGISRVYDETTNQFDFSQLKIGDAIMIRLDYSITTTNANQKYHFDLKLGVGSPTEFQRRVFEQEVKTAGTSGAWVTMAFTLDYQDIVDYPCELYVTSDANATFVNNGYKVEVIQKDLNIVSIVADVDDATSSVKGIVKLAGDLGGTADLPTVPSLVNKVDKIAPITAGIGTKFTVNSQGQIVSYTNAGITDITGLESALTGKQPLLISGTNIKTINGASLLGGGDITFGGSILTSVISSGDTTHAPDGNAVFNALNNKLDKGTYIGTAQDLKYAIDNGDASTLSSANTYTDNAISTIDLSGKEDKSNKQNSLTVDGTGIKYPTVDAVNTGLATKISGTGTTNYIPKFTGTGFIGNSNLSDDGILVTSATDMSVNVLRFGRGTGNNITSVVLGYLANAAAANNVSIGVRANASNTTGTGNTAVGAETLRFNTTGSKNTAVGYGALNVNVTGGYLSAFGDSALTKCTVGFNDAFGQSSQQNNINSQLNSSFAVESLFSLTTGGSNCAFGASSLYSMTTGSFNVAIGRWSGRLINSGAAAVTVNNSVFLGYDTRPNADSETNQIVIGYQGRGLGSNSTVLGNSSTIKTGLYGRVLIGGTLGLPTDDLTSALQINGDVKIVTTPTTSAGSFDILTRNSSTGVVEKIVNATISSSGNYTPTLTSVSNVSSLVLDKARYIKVGNIVTVTVSFTGSITTSSTLTRITISLPQARTLTNGDYVGSASCMKLDNTFVNAGRFALLNNTTEVQAYFIPAATGAASFQGTFTYDISQ